MLYEVQGDRIGFWDSAALGRGEDGSRHLALSGVRALGTRHDRFVLNRVPPPAGDTEADCLHFALCYPSGELLVPGLIARPASWDGFACGSNHIVFDETQGGARVVLDLRRLPRGGGPVCFDKPRVRLGAPDDTAIAGMPPVSLPEGTMVLTGRGRQPVEDLAAGDGVWTLDNGVRRIGWRMKQRVRLGGPEDQRRPILFRAHSLTTGLPDKPVRLSPDHPVLIAGWKAELFFGRTEVLVPARALLSWDGVERDRTASEVTYHCLLLDTQEILNAGGLLCGSPSPREVLGHVGEGRHRRDLWRAIPTLRILDGRLSAAPARPVVGDSGQTEFMDTCLV